MVSTYREPLFRDFNPLTDRRPEYFELRPPLSWQRLLFAWMAASGNWTRGADLSHHNGAVNPKLLWDSGIRFVWLKVTESTNFKDSRFTENWKKLLDYGFLVGGYHFQRANTDGGAQAEFFLENLYPLVNAADGVVLPCLLDSETRDGQTNSTIIQVSTEWFSVVKAEMRKPAFYSSPYLFGSMYTPAPSWVKNYWLDLAHWTSASAPLWISAWLAELRKFWQYGIAQRHTWVDPIWGTESAEVDAQWFLGSLAELRQICGYNEPPPPPPPPPPPDDLEKRVASLEMRVTTLESGLSVVKNEVGLNTASIIKLLDAVEGLKEMDIAILNRLLREESKLSGVVTDVGAAWTKYK